MKKNLILLFIIFFVAQYLRFNNLANIPVGFHIDEASLGYNAYSLLLTGKDENNHAWPLYIDMFGDNRPSGYHYLTVIPVKFFGLSVFSTRFMSAFFGSITVFALYFLTYILFKNKKVSLLSSLLIAVAPWHVVLSRASAEAIVSLFLIIVGFGCIFLSLSKKKPWGLPVGGLLLSLSFFFYHTPRVFVPLLFFIYILYFFWKYKSQLSGSIIRTLFITFIALSIIAASLVFAVNGGTARFTQVNIFGFPETKLVMQEQIREDGVSATPVSNTRFYHNKLINYSLTFISNYFSYFNGDFLFVKGGLPIWYVVPNMGLIYLIELPFLLFGVYKLLVNKNPIYKLPVIWLLIAPVVASFTVDDVPNINRAIVMFPMIEIISAYGFVDFVSILSRRKVIAFTAGISILFIANVLYFRHQYMVHASVHRTWYRNNGFDKLMSVLKGSYNNFDKIIITKHGVGYPLVLFYMQYDPKAYQQAGSPKDRDYSGFGKFLFVPQACPSITSDNRFPKSKNVIFVDAGDCPEDKALLDKKTVTILKEDKTKAFRIVYYE